MTDTQNNQSQDDQVLAELYKAGAKETAPAKLNYEIINYAKNAEKHSGSSHFAGDWKVPLSLAASVVVVFGLLVQLDQSPEQLELPPIPEISAPAESTTSRPDKTQTNPLNKLEETKSEDISTYNKDIKESEPDALGDAQMEERTLNQKQGPKKQEAKRKSDTSLEFSREPLRSEQPLEKSKPSGATSIEEFDSDNRSSPATEDIRQQKSVEGEQIHSEEYIDTTSDVISGAEIQRNRDTTESTKQEFTPIPVEDWLLMIEKLIARKDYAEAARQLQKFKQAHPKVNVEDLEAKIP